MNKRYAHQAQIIDFLISEYPGYKISLEEIPTNFPKGTKTALAISDVISSETWFTTSVRIIRVKIPN